MSAGLPALNGTVDFVDSDTVSVGLSQNSYLNGVFYQFNPHQSKLYSSSKNTYGACDIGFNASLSSSVYGASNTVTPKSIKVLRFIKY